MDRGRMLLTMAAGAVCGALATAPMTGVMILAQRMLPRRSREPLEPRQITDAILDETPQGSELPEEDRRGAALAAHFGYGAATGTAYPFFEREFRRLPARGAAFGLALYALSYAGWLPATGILPLPHRRPSGRNALLIAAHLVWGAALQGLYSAWENENGVVQDFHRRGLRG